MRFEKISENKLKIILSNDELPNSNDLDNFMKDSEKAKNSFVQLLDQAKVAVGFNAQDYKIKIDAKAMKNGDYVFLITKLVKLRHGNRVVRPRPVEKGDVDKTEYAVYKFDTFDDFCDFCSYLKSHQINYLNIFCKSNSLYKYGNYFYLVINHINSNYKLLASFYSSITEFSKFFSTKPLFECTLKEHGTLIFENKAMSMCQKMFKWAEA